MKKEELLKWLTRYLIGYGLLHLATIVVLFAFERWWGAFVYLAVFWLHIPFAVLGTIAVLLAKKSQNAWIWLLATILFVLSTGQWISALSITFRGNFFFIPCILLVAFPIFCTVRLFVLARK